MALVLNQTVADASQKEGLFALSYRFSKIPYTSSLVEFYERRRIRRTAYRPRIRGLVGTSSGNTFSNGAVITKDETVNQYFINGEVDAGVLSVEQQYTFFLTSMFDENLSISGIYVTPGQAISVTSPPVGTALYRYVPQEVTLVLEEEGSARINADVIFTLSNGFQVGFRVVAVRTPLGWLFNVNWLDGLEYSRRFLTSVLITDDGTETRKILRNVPIREASVPLLTSNQQEAYFALLSLKNAAESTQFIPIYTDASITTAPAVLSTYRVYCPTNYYRFEVGGLAAIAAKGITGTEYFEILEVTTIHADGLTVRFPIGQDYPAGSTVYPLEECTIRPDGLSMDLLTNQKSVVNLTVTSKYGTTEQENAAYSPTISKGYPVFPFLINWRETVTVNVVSSAILEDSGRGQKNVAPLYRSTCDWSITSFSRTRAEYWEILGFMNYIKGQGKAFFVEFPLDWLPLDYAITDTSFQLSDYTFGLDLEDRVQYLKVSNGTQSAIVAVTDIYTAGDSGAVIDVEPHAVSGVTEITQMIPVRMTSDDITEKWFTDGFVEFNFSVKELPKG